MKDAVDRVIEERRRMERGFASSVYLSLGVHLLVVGGAFAAQLALPRGPQIEVADAFAVALPRGGGGTPDVPPPAPAPEPEAKPEPPAPEPPPEVIKPPREEPPPPAKQGIPAPDAEPAKPRPKATPRPATGLTGGPGTGSQTPGLEFAPAGPGIPGGTDRHGDWYLAGVQQKIWMIWTQQIHSDFTTPVRVQFTIHADGSVSGVRVVQRSGAALLDLAAQRAVLSAAPFAPIPSGYGSDRITIVANFKPTGRSP